MSENPIEKRNREFHLAIGKCISAWAWVDEGLFQLFAACVKPRTQAAIIYYRTPGLEVRLGLTDEIVRSVLPKPGRKNGGHDHQHVKEWAVLRNEIQKLLETRRRVAHHPVHVSFWGVEEDETGKVSDVDLDATSFEIYVSAHERDRNPAKEWNALSIGDLNEHHTAVRAMEEKLDQFLSVLVQYYAK